MLDTPSIAIFLLAASILVVFGTVVVVAATLVAIVWLTPHRDRHRVAPHLADIVRAFLRRRK